MKTLSADAQTMFVKINSNQIAYRVFGQGAPLLFYNRFRGILDTWDPLFLDSLANEHTIILFDYPGIGDSTGELPTDIYEVANFGMQLANHLEIEKFDVAGWSYGGLVAQAALFANTERIKNAVLIGTNPPGKNDVPIEKDFFDKALKPINDLEDEYVLFYEPSSEKSKQAANASHERIALRLERNKIPSTQEKFQRYFGGSAVFREDMLNLRDKYRTITNPVLVISGDHDISFAVENRFPLLKRAPTMQHLIMNDSGHAPQHQHPELIAGYIKRFLREG